MNFSPSGLTIRLKCLVISIVHFLNLTFCVYSTRFLFKQTFQITLYSLSLTFFGERRRLIILVSSILHFCKLLFSKCSYLCKLWLLFLYDFFIYSIHWSLAKNCMINCKLTAEGSEGGIEFSVRRKSLVKK